MLSFVAALVIIVHVIIRGGCVSIIIGFDVNITVFYTTDQRSTDQFLHSGEGFHCILCPVVIIDVICI